MTRKRNINFGFLPARPTRADLLKSRREFKARVREQVKQIRAERKRQRKSARAAFPGKKKLESLFHEVYGRNPAEQSAAIDRCVRGGDMANRKRRSKKKKRNPRKGVMPAGLKAYWARKRRGKAKRKNPRRRRRSNPKVRIRTRTVVKYRYRARPKRKANRRRKSNPRRTAKRINLKGFTSGQIQRVASAIRRATGKRVRIVRP